MSLPVPALEAFPMPAERRFPAVLLGFGVLSLLAHAATFLLFQASYPPHVTIPPQVTQVTLLTGHAANQQALMRWIESEDPALVAASAHPVPEHLFETPYRPSYMVLRTPPRSMPLTEEVPARAPGPELSALLRSVSSAPASEPRKVSASLTELRLFGPLTARSAQPVTPISLRALAPGPLEEVSALLGVNSEGSVRYTVLQKSSGDASTDAAALAALARLPFSPGAENSPVVWGFASIIWGDDAYAETAAPRR